MLFLTIITRVVYWYMDHNNPNKCMKQEKSLKKQKSCVKTVRIVEPEKTASFVYMSTENTVTAIEESQNDVNKSYIRTKTEYKCTGCTNEDTTRRNRWDKNEMDYMGQDSFDNIKAKLNQSMGQ
ncbi:uncharacterized protein LOC132550955 [Ylistrum balloti]|uniref:uncharacterized protein LOC132550955 n=1 Tax=Ylistrum balloti TaxID=509963 RepID=UPI002905A7DC|nr:uncharacterized protein LOC132550955 [Ylistrum balloti]